MRANTLRHSGKIKLEGKHPQSSTRSRRMNFKARIFYEVSNSTWARLQDFIYALTETENDALRKCSTPSKDGQAATQDQNPRRAPQNAKGRNEHCDLRLNLTPAKALHAFAATFTAAAAAASTFGKRSVSIHCYIEYYSPLP